MKQRSWFRLCVMLGVGVTLAGCLSPGEYADKRRQQLLAIYPPEKTTRADVEDRWKPVQPKLSLVRSADGWGSVENPYLRQHIIAAEERAGRPIYRSACYLGPDGWSGGLCLCWFYYDDRDRLVDAEWQWHTD